MESAPYQDRILTYETAFSDVPELRSAEGEEGYVAESGECWMKMTLHVEPNEYFTYLDQIECARWKPYVTHTSDPIQGVVYAALFTKGERYLCATYYAFNGGVLPRKLLVAVGLLPAGYVYEPYALFHGIPRMPKDIPHSTLPVDVGDKHYLKVIPDVEREEYDAYLTQLESEGFRRFFFHAGGIANRVFAAGFTKGRRTLSVTYVSPLKEIHLSVGKGGKFSPYLVDDPSRRQGFAPDVRTSVHMLELWNFGNSFIVRLKNGHFLINDGGSRCETPYLLDYLDGLVPKGEKIVVEGWFISHAHIDHSGVLIEMALNPVWAERISVEGIYFSEPSLELFSVSPGDIGVAMLLRLADRYLRTSAGTPTPFYRPHLGDRYYFADITVDVIMTQEQVRYKNYSGDLNDTSTWFMLTIEGQKVLFGGDGDKAGRQFIMSVYSSNYMVVDVMSVLHHGFNTSNDFTNYCHAKTVLFTCYGSGPWMRRRENDYLRARAQESFSWGEGTRVLTFPYRVGESVCLPHFDWDKYNAGEERPTQPNAREKRE